MGDMERPGQAGIITVARREAAGLARSVRHRSALWAVAHAAGSGWPSTLTLAAILMVAVFAAVTGVNVALHVIAWLAGVMTGGGVP